ncbi:unnamed protein product, partial [Iphiclides podalirius]
MKGGTYTAKCGPISAHNLPADATNTKRLYSRRTQRAAGGREEGARSGTVQRVGLLRPSAGRRGTINLTSRARDGIKA